MKKTFKVFCTLVCFLSIVLLMMAGCDMSLSALGGGDGTIPVYTGMYCSTVKNTSKSMFLDAGVDLSGEENINNENEDNIGGWHGGDSVDDQEYVDQNMPFPDANETIEEEIKNSLEVVGGCEALYYAEKGGYVYLHIQIRNPDQYEILSFTLNGEKYSSYMFEEGSTQELLILKYNVGDVSGVVEYTIDQIKYIDGTEIKDVKIEGDKTVGVGIRRENQVVSRERDYEIGTNSISFNARISDNDGLIAYSSGKIKAVLYDGEELIAEQELSVGNNEVVFDELKNGAVYQYAIVACYDDFTGGTWGYNTLSTKAFRTNNVVLFDKVDVGYNQVNFEFKWNDSVTDKSLTALKLYKDGVLLDNLDVESASVTGLLSNSKYTLVADYVDLDKTESIFLDFITFAQGEPRVNFNNLSNTLTSISGDYTVIDDDSALVSANLELYLGEKLIFSSTSRNFTFTNLVTGALYTVKLSYAYDLNDGRGIVNREIIKNISCSSSGLEYKVSMDGTAIITGIGTCTDMVLYIPYTIDGYTVASIGSSAFKDFARITSVMIPGSVTNIGGTAFSGCANLSSVVISNGVISIGPRAFESCYNLTSVELPDSVTSIDIGAFRMCSNLTSIVIKGNVTSIAQNMFYGCTRLEKVEIPDSVTIIDHSAFGNCKSLTSIKIPDGVTSIGPSAFYDCSSLTSIVIPEGVTVIERYAFEGCSSLANIVIPEGVTTIERYAFEGCSSFTSIVIPKSVISIEQRAFSMCTGVTSITYNGTLEQWKFVSKSATWSNGILYSTEVICSDGKITLNDGR